MTGTICKSLEHIIQAGFCSMFPLEIKKEQKKLRKESLQSPFFASVSPFLPVKHRRTFVTSEKISTRQYTSSIVQRFTLSNANSITPLLIQ